MDQTLKLDCSACKGTKTMGQAKVSKMSPVVVVIGWILTAPSILGILFSVIMFFSALSAGSTVSSQAVSDAEQAGAAVGTAAGVGISIVLGIFSLVGGLVGYLLIMKKKVYKCLTCGFVVDRA